ncbi:hypothetical protein CR513_58716, partial [Mucuna pruriens]
MKNLLLIVHIFIVKVVERLNIHHLIAFRGQNRMCSKPSKLITNYQLHLDLLDSKKNTPIIVPRQQLLITHDKRNVYVSRL